MTIETWLTSGVVGLILTLIVETIKWFIDRKDKKAEKKDEVLEKLEQIQQEIEKLKQNDKKTEKDLTRIQLITMIDNHPKKVDEIMQLAEHYFRDDKGNWYATSLFKEWLQEVKIDKPDWFEQTEL